ncbi:hypothetical protein M569_15054 [Genlisea aurea]|uniref:Late embryogenesis abundant protein LEA-2 subgroup domain-containing protein n=1 Tax=Genlisea aurea TaxID=192259 RepID=S8DAM8_9LAMI|nr:hypothetical protein M569_15054 [Genlisea aurea]
MASQAGTSMPSLQKPPGYRDPTFSGQPPPPHRKPINLPPTFRPQKRRRRSCCCCCCVSLALLILLLAVVATSLYFWFQPRLPEIHLKSTDFKNFTVVFRSDGPEVNAESTIGIQINNPNQNFKVEFPKTRVSLDSLNGKVDLGEGSIPGFVQAAKNRTTLKLTVAVRNEIVDKKSAEELMNGIKKQSLHINAVVKTGVGFKWNKLATGIAPVTVSCRGITLAAAAGSPKCRIKILNWFFIN